MSEQKKVISISTTRKKVMGQVDVDGVMVDVLQLDFDTEQRVTAADGTAKYLGEIRAAVTKLCPALTAEQVGSMTIDDGQKIVLYAGGGVRAVEALYPNADSPETPTSPG